MHTILTHQNDETQITLLKASSIAYKNAKSKEFLFSYALAFLALAYPVVYIFIKDENIKHSLFALSLFITVTTWVTADYFKGNTTKGALIKEQFDISLYNLPWRFTLQKPNQDDILALAKQYKGKDEALQNWYPPNLLETIPTNTAIAICQRISSAWDIRLREFFNIVLYFILGIYTFGVLLLWAFNSVDSRTIFLLYFSTLSFYSHLITMTRGHKAAIKKRKEITAKLDSHIERKEPFTEQQLRDVQNELYYIRQESSKVPDYFCKKQNGKIAVLFQEYVQKINGIY
jgi:hypothetical protein